MKRSIESILSSSTAEESSHHETEVQQSTKPKHSSRSLSVRLQELMGDLQAQRTRLVSLLGGQSAQPRRSSEAPAEPDANASGVATPTSQLDRQLHCLVQSLIVSNMQHEIAYKRISAALLENAPHVEWKRLHYIRIQYNVLDYSYSYVFLLVPQFALLYSVYSFG